MANASLQTSKVFRNIWHSRTSLHRTLSNSSSSCSCRQNWSSISSNRLLKNEENSRQISHFRDVRNLVGSTRLYCSTSAECWNCHAELPRSSPEGTGADDSLAFVEHARVPSFFCSLCNMIQPLQDELNHFQRMGL